jgi:4-amino-4-deoxy-L-arabinose transferase-like glycosyltransferase
MKMKPDNHARELIVGLLSLSNPDRIPPMRRWFAVFLLVFLPLQSSWAVTASYCQHESGAAAQHFGHHEHEHHGNSADANALDGCTDGDCATCHASCATALTGMTLLPTVLSAFEGNLWRPAALPSPPDTLPERPNWIVSA